jgi:hypothetical protein
MDRTYGAWRNRVRRADGTVRTEVLRRERPWDPPGAEVEARGWHAWIAGMLDGKSRLDAGEVLTLERREPGQSRYVTVESCARQ